MADDWHDPFSEDEAARERERRRAEREAKRRARREGLGQRVSEELGRKLPPSAGGPASGPPEGPGSPRRPATGGPEPEATPDRPAPLRTAAQPPARPPGDALLGRRVVAIAAVAAVVTLVAIGAVVLADRLGGDGEPAPPEPAAKVSTLTIPEGLDRAQIAGVAEEAGLRGDYERESRSFKGFDPGRHDAGDPPSLEGFLFPATYELPRKPTVGDLISRQLAAFEDSVDRVDLSYAKSKNLNVYDVLKIASMVEREIQVPEERRLAAAVIYNRLADGSPLGIDATIRYEDQNYDEQLTQSRLDQDTPYNTRTNAGLPPTPIGNPGLASIKAAANPARSDAFYFVIKPGTCGEHVFVETEEEFAEAEAEYQAALEAEGGSPTEC